MISTIIASYRNPKYLDLCLKSITENKVLDSTEVVVVLDGFVEESQTVVDKYPGISVLPLDSNMGMQYAINVGVMQATNEYVFVINDDNVFGKEWDRILSDVIDTYRTENDEKFVFTVNQVEPTGPGMFHFPVKDLGKTVESFQYVEWLEHEQQIRKENDITNDGHIFPYLLTKKHYLAVGGMDTFYDSPNICDWDFFLRLELLGFTFPRTHALHLYHFGSVATKKNAEQSSFRSREQIAFDQYTWKWGAVPHNEIGTNSKVPRDKQFRGFKL